MEELRLSTDEFDEVLVREHPDGLWVVLADEYPQQQITAGDLPSIDER